MIKVNDETGQVHFLNRTVISRVSSRSGASSLRYNAIVHLDDGTILYVQETVYQIVESMEKESTS